jgi:hypothetical protein
MGHDAGHPMGMADAGSTSPDAGPVSPDAGPVDAGGGDPDAGPTACTTLANVGAEVPIVGVAASMPTPTGGTIKDGTYVLTAMTAYTGPGGPTGPQADKQSNTMRITGANWESVGTKNGKDNVPNVGTWSVSGTTFTMTETCPFPISLPQDFDATDNQIKTYFPGQTAGTGLVVTLTRH